MEKSDVFGAVEERREDLEDLAREIWEDPELSLKEVRAAGVLQEFLESAGFSIEKGQGGMPTAFVASVGSGETTIGILGEYDALPGLSQSTTASPHPVEPGGAGHGCGHNLFGVASAGAAIAVAEAIEDGAIDGEVRFYGTPAEETIVGKPFMARDGAFDDLDAALAWHPCDVTGPQRSSSLAVDSVRYTFEGTPAHAAQSPTAGRSALDGVELMNVGVEYMREHVSEKARVHHTITDGGNAPNVVPGEATVWYFIRAPTRSQVDRISAWVDDIAKGAATMTQTAVNRRYVTGAWEFLVNETIADTMGANLKALGEIEYTQEDRDFATELQQTIDPEVIEERLERVPAGERDAMRSHSLYSEPMECTDAEEIMMGSTDVADVSWITPTAQFRVASWAVGTTPHTWQAVAASGDFGTKSAVYAAKALAGTAYDLFDDEELLAAATQEFERESAHTVYESPIPEDVEPPFDVSFNG